MELNWINLFGLVIDVVLIAPHLFYVVKRREAETPRGNQGLLLLARIGCCAALLLMVFPLGVGKFGFPNVFALVAYLLGNGILLFVYLVTWILYARKRSRRKALALAILPACIFLIGGVTLHHWLLVTAALWFGICHGCLTYKRHGRG